MIFAVVAFIALFAEPSQDILGDEHEVCMGHPFSDSSNGIGWIADTTLKLHVSKRVASPIPSVEVNLGAFPPHSEPCLSFLTAFRSPT